MNAEEQPDVSMKYRVTHTTTYQYESSVNVSHNQVLLLPREAPGIRCHRSHLNIQPPPDISSQRLDYFGNRVHSFSIEESHRRLVVTAHSEVEVFGGGARALERSPVWQEVVKGVKQQSDPRCLEASLYQFDSQRVHRSLLFAEYGRRAFGVGRPILAAALELTQQIFADFQYDSKATDVNTSVEQAFELRRGVCQDFAQVQIAVLRSLGLAARYVSGYLRTIPPEGKTRLIGADQSHAWLSLYCGEEWGWVDLDPTNQCLCGTDHVPIAWGRDYSDVVPFRGVFLGGGQHQLTVSVDVCPV